MRGRSNGEEREGHEGRGQQARHSATGWLLASLLSWEMPSLRSYQSHMAITRLKVQPWIPEVQNILP